MTQEEFTRLAAVWLRRGTWTPKQAARLLAEQDPVRPPYVGEEEPETGLAMHICDLVLSFPAYRVERTPAEWVALAKQQAIHVPPALETLIQPQSAPATVVPWGKKWTPEKLAELKAYRDAHTMLETAAHYDITEQRIRQLLPSKKAKAQPFSGLMHRPK